MKITVILAVVAVCFAGAVRAGPPPVNPTLAGSYSWTVPGSTWRLLLSSSGHYTITTQGGPESRPEPLETGAWRFEGFVLLLESKQPAVGGNSEYRRLHVLEKKSGQLMLVSAIRSESYFGQPFGEDTLFDFVFVKEPLGADKRKQADKR